MKGSSIERLVRSQRYIHPERLSASNRLRLTRNDDLDSKLTHVKSVFV